MLIAIFSEGGSFLGKSGVAILFTLSAYILTELYMYSNRMNTVNAVLRFYKKRFFKIYPPLIVVLIMTTIVGWSSIREALLALFMIKGKSHLWVLPLEFAFYAVFPFLVIMLKRFSDNIKIFILSFASASIWYIYFFSPLKNNSYTLLYCLPMFLCGMLVAVISHKYQEELRNLFNDFVYKYLCAFIVIAFECMGLIYYRLLKALPIDNKLCFFLSNNLEHFRLLFCSLLFSVILLCIVNGKNIKMLLGKIKWMQDFGIISYPFYLIHHIVLYYVSVICKEYVSSILCVIFAFSISVVLSILMYMFVERPMTSIAKDRCL